MAFAAALGTHAGDNQPVASHMKIALTGHGVAKLLQLDHAIDWMTVSKDDASIVVVTEAGIHIIRAPRSPEDRTFVEDPFASNVD